jgi:ring-1,2-phenylacetyl-CoA epoxidase subunit PaaC
MATDAVPQPLVTYLLRHGDRALVLGQRLSEWLTRAHELEEELALGNLALDLLGQARTLYSYAGLVEGAGRSEDDLAYGRTDREFFNPLLVEQPNGDFAVTMMRQFLHDAWAVPFWQAMSASTDVTLAALAGKAVKETAYHLRHARSWVVRLGDGTGESHARTQAAVDRLWRFVDELFDADAVEAELVAVGVAVAPGSLRAPWQATVDATFADATLTVPAGGISLRGGRTGRHGESLSYLLGELQVVARAHPGATW